MKKCFAFDETFGFGRVFPLTKSSYHRMSTFQDSRGTFAHSACRSWLVVLLLFLPFCALPALGQYVIAGRITDGTNQISGVTVTAQLVGQAGGQSVTTSSSGDYSFSLQPGSYSVIPTKGSTVFEPISCLRDADCSTNAIVTIGLNLPVQTNINFSVVYNIAGRVTEGTKGASGVQVTVSDYPQTALTDSSGNYALTGFQRGSYTLTATSSSYTFDSATLVVNVTSNVTTANFSAHSFFIISGRITNGRTPVPGASVVLQNVSTLVTLTNTTDVTGNFGFSNLAFASYSVTPSLTGYVFNPVSKSVSSATNISFTVLTQNLIGHVTDGATGLGLPSVTVSAITATNVITTLTDINGNYSFKNLAGSYLIMPSSDGQQFNPARRTLSVGSGPSSVDFQRGPTLFDELVSSCDFPSLQLALAAGGKVGFDCGGAVGTITFTETVTIATNATLEGASATLSGGNTVRLFTVSPTVNFTLAGLTLTAGKDGGVDGTNGTAGLGGNGGAIFNDGGVLLLTNCVLSANAASGGNGGSGVLQINGAGGGGGRGGNAFGGAIFNKGGSVALTNCMLSGNSATAGAGGAGADAGSGGNGNNGGSGGSGGSGSGGAIYSTNGTVIIYDCTCASNTVSGATGGSGGLATGLGSNGANGAPGPALSGGIHNDGGTLIVLYSTFNGNGATAASGGTGAAGVGENKGSSGTPGSTAGGGAIYNKGGSLALTNCTFDANGVTGGQGGNGGAGGSSGFGGNGGDGGSGGSGTGGGVCNALNGSVVLVNCTIADNSAQGGFGGSGGAAGSSFVKAGQDGSLGEDFGGGIANLSGTLTLKNTMVGYSAAGGNGAGAIVDGGHNLSDDASFALTATGSQAYTNLDLRLGFLADNDGPTWTLAILSSDSPAVDAGDDAAAPAADQRHFARAGARSDIGAFEFNGWAPIVTLSIRRQTNQVVLSWTSALSGYSLQSNPDLSSNNWATLTNVPAEVTNIFVTTEDATNSRRFYRLIKP
jgi:hypothetical protein